MKVEDFISVYRSDNQLVELVKWLSDANLEQGFLDGVAGSLDTIIIAATYAQMTHFNHFVIADDSEEAYYFLTDLNNLIPKKEVLFFPTSYKRPYHFEETDNANVLRRSEVLSELNKKKPQGDIIITYPDALSEKVINRQSLTSNTYIISKGDELDIEFLTEVLISYDFEKTDFTYEPGQFSVRGGIVDVYSFASDLPYRLEYFGDEVESIRSFDPESQLSKNELVQISLVPNMQNRLLKETRVSMFDYLPKNTIIWIKNRRFSADVVDQYFDKASASFSDIVEKSGDTQVILKPEQVFDQIEDFNTGIKKFKCLEFTNRTEGKGFFLNFESKVQQSFDKNFELIAESFERFQLDGFRNFVFSESTVQLNKLTSIFDEINDNVAFKPVYTGLRQGYVDYRNMIVCYTDHQLFDRFYRSKGQDRFSKNKSLTFKELKALKPGDFVVHIDHGVGRFAGLDTKETNGRRQEVIRLVYRDNDLLYLSVHSLHKISKYSAGDGAPPAINKLGSQEWDKKKKKVKKQVKDIAKDLIELYAKRKATKGIAFPTDNYLQDELETSFIYQDTPDQAVASENVKKDMEKDFPMDRLVCGDVGFGKTEVAIRAAFKAASNSKQVAVLVPTTILALQHYNTFKERLRDFPVKVEYINRFKTTKQIKETLGRVKEGKTEILIGTHRIVNKDVVFKELGLLIIDEEQKFGVKVKDKLKDLRVNVDTLTLSATPIPRTLHFSLMGARDLSVISLHPLIVNL